MKRHSWTLLGLVSVGRISSVSVLFPAFLAAGCSTVEEYTHRDEVAVVAEIDSVPQGAEVYIARTPSDVLPGEPGGEWVAKGGFGFVGRTPVRVEDQIIRSTKGARKVLNGDVVVYETTGPSVYQENKRRIVLLKPGYSTVDVMERFRPETHLRFILKRTEEEKEVGSGAPEVLPGPQGRLSIVSVPSPAEVEVDGHYVGQTPATVQLPPGIHQLLVRRAGHADWRREINILPASDQKISVTLEEAQTIQQEGEPKSP